MFGKFPYTVVVCQYSLCYVHVLAVRDANNRLRQAEGMAANEVGTTVTEYITFYFIVVFYN